MTKHIRLRLLSKTSTMLTVLAGDGKRFVALFRDCWRQLPYAARRKILAHWRVDAHAGFPYVELSNAWVSSSECYGQVTSNGQVLKFSADDFEVLPSSIARWEIAHEVAHVYQKACGIRPGGMSERENEEHANEIAEQWGFDRMPRILLDMLIQCRKLTVKEACKEIKDIIGD